MFKSAVHLAIFRDSRKKILLTQRKDNHLWVMPGGHLEAGESFEQAVVREVEEEIGLKIKVIELVLVLKIPKSKQEKRVYIGEVVGGDEKLSGEVIDIGWFQINKLPLMTLYEKERIRYAIGYKDRAIVMEYRVEVFREMLNLLVHPGLLVRSISTELKHRTNIN